MTGGSRFVRRPPNVSQICSSWKTIGLSHDRLRAYLSLDFGIASDNVEDWRDELERREGELSKVAESEAEDETKKKLQFWLGRSGTVALDY